MIENRETLRYVLPDPVYPSLIFTIHPNEKKGSLLVNLHKRLKLKKIDGETIFSL
jgi:hypothetical protein